MRQFPKHSPEFRQQVMTHIKAGRTSVEVSVLMETTLGVINGIRRREQRNDPDYTPKPKRKREVFPPTPIKAEKRPADGKRFADLNGRDCRWPFGDPRKQDFVCCGKSTGSIEKPYCEKHMARATVVRTA